MNKKLFLFVLLVLLNFSLFAQNNEVVVDSSVQRLEWESTGVVKNYKIIVEKKQETGYVVIIEDTTTNNYYNVRLGSGSYRYKVIFYNVLGKKSFETEYATFEIVDVYKPRVTVENYLYNLSDKDFDGTIKIEVKNICVNTKFQLIGKGRNKDVILEPLNVELKGKYSYLYFEKEQIVPGSYYLKVTNSEGLESHTIQIDFKKNKILYYDASFGNTLTYVLVSDYAKSVYQKNFFNIGLEPQFSAYYKMNDNFKVGAGFIASGTSLLSEIPNEYSIEGILHNWNLMLSAEYKPVSINGFDIYLTGFGLFGIEGLTEQKIFFYSPSYKVLTLPPTYLFDIGVGGSLKVGYKHIYIYTAAKLISQLNLITKCDTMFVTATFDYGLGFKF